MQLSRDRSASRPKTTECDAAPIDSFLLRRKPSSHIDRVRSRRALVERGPLTKSEEESRGLSGLLLSVHQIDEPMSRCGKIEDGRARGYRQLEIEHLFLETVSPGGYSQV